MGSRVARKRSGQTFRLRPEILFHAAVLAAATTIVSLGSRTQSARGKIPCEDEVRSAVALHASSAVRAAAQKQIAMAEKTWTEAHRRGDAALLRRLLASEFTFTGPTGRVSDTKEYLTTVGAASATASTALLDTVESRYMRTRIYGETAVVSGETVARGHRDGKVVKESTRFLRVYVNRDGRWQMVAGQDTLAPAGANG